MTTYARLGILLVALLLTSCTSLHKRAVKDSPAGWNNNSTASNSATESEVEKMKPAAGTGNIQGKVLYNGKPAENIEVRLCEKFNRFMGGCDGQKFVARTDKNGEYVITNVPPSTYEALTARVFDSNFYVFATTGIGYSSSTHNH